jgi:hypothetical protein
MNFRRLDVYQFAVRFLALASEIAAALPQRHAALAEQHAALTRRVQGHLNYFGVNGNTRALNLLVHEAQRLWHKWLNRRSQRRRLTWERFNDLLEVFPLPKPTIRVQIWARAT